MRDHQIEGSQPFFIADTHFGHRNVLRHAKRPFASVEEMDYEMIRRWNETVPPDRDVYHVGDFSFRTDDSYALGVLRQLNGRIHLIVGNHDSDAVIESDLWASVQWYKEIKFHKQRIVLLHYPLRTWNKRYGGAWALTGHSHGKTREALPDNCSGGLLLDVGVDVHDFRPVSFLEIRDIMVWKQEERDRRGMLSGMDRIRELDTSPDLRGHRWVSDGEVDPGP